MWCPECDEEIDRKEVVENDNKCPVCGYDFKEGEEESDEESKDDFDDLMMTDFAADGELDGDF